MGQTLCASLLPQPWAKATGDIKQRWQPALLVAGLPQKVAPVGGGTGMPELCGAVRAWREGNVVWPRPQAALKGSWTSPCPTWGLGTAREGQQVAPSWFCELAQAGAQAGWGMGRVMVLALPVCCSGGPGSACWCCGSACCAAGAALPCAILCSGLISLQRSCTNGCYSSGATRCCQWPWETTSMTWGKSPGEGWDGGARGALQLCPGADGRAVCALPQPGTAVRCSHHGAAPAALGTC